MSSEDSNQPINIATELQQRYAQGERNFKKAYLTEADLRDVDLRGTDFEGANLTGAYLRGANFKEANLKRAFLKESDLRGANLSAADLKGAFLNGACLELTMLHGANLQEANLKGASLGGAMLIRANLDRADLTFADLSDTYMVAQGGSGGANLAGANLRGVELKGANLKGANLNGANLREAKLKGAFLQGAYYDNQTNFPAGFDPTGSGMQKSKNSSSKKLNTSAPQNLKNQKPTLSIGGIAFVAVMLAAIAIFQTWTNANKSKLASKAKTESEVSVQAGRPVTEAEIEAKLKAGRPVTEAEIEAMLKAGRPVTEAEIEAMLKGKKLKSVLAANSQSKTQTALTFVNKVASCPVLVRVINAASPDRPSAVDLRVNGKQLISKVTFSQASRYTNTSAGRLRIQIMKAGTRKIVGTRTFTAAPNSAYSIAVTGPLPGPKGKLLFNKSPFVIPEDLSPPKQGNFKGGWYNLSEMKAVNDLLITKPSAANNVDVARLFKLLPKTTIDYPQLQAGTYSFKPVLPKKSEPLVNKAYKPTIRVEIAKAIPAGTLFDVFAIGNTLGKGRNSLKLSAASYKTFPRTPSGCIRVK